MTEMQQRLAFYINEVHANIRLGLANDDAREEAIALFRIARCLTPRYLPQDRCERCGKPLPVKSPYAMCGKCRWDVRGEMGLEQE